MDINGMINKFIYSMRDFIKPSLKINFKSFEERIVYYIISLTLIIDFFNGFFITYLGIDSFTLGKIFRTSILVICFLYIVRHDIKRMIIIVLCTVPLVVSSIISVQINGEPFNVIIYDIKEIVRLMYLIMIVNTFIVLAKADKVSSSIVYRAILNNCIALIPILLVSILLGIGSSSYDGVVGYKSTFTSLNSLTASLLMMFAFAYDNIFKNEHKKLSILLFLVVTIFLLLLGSKSGYALSVLIVLAYTLMETDKESRAKQLKLIISGVGVIFLLLITIFRNSFVEILQRQFHFISDNTESIMTYILSGRNELLAGAHEALKDDFSIRRVLIGVGSYTEQVEIARNLPLKYNNITFKNIEMDIFDIFYSYGIYGVAITYGLVMKVMANSIGKIDISKQRPYAISAIILIIYSILGGHVFNEAMSGTFLGASLLGLMIKTK